MSILHPPSSIAKYHSIYNVPLVQSPLTLCSRPHRDESGGRRTAMNLHTKGKKKKVAAFLDVDGTITRTNVVAAYFCSRVREIPVAARVVWVPWFALSCVLYLIIDHIDRIEFNHLFYSLFKDQSALKKNNIGRMVYQDYYQPRTFKGAVEMIRRLKQQGYRIVLVTGSLDFLIAPLAHELGADFVYASELVEEDGKFTGEFKGAGASELAKANFVESYAREHEICLSSSMAFGDSVADLSMLESVGSPHVVNPDNQLKEIAASRDWPIITWELKNKKDPWPFDFVGSPHVVNPDNQLKEIAASRDWPIITWELKKDPWPFDFVWLTSILSSTVNKFKARRKETPWSLNVQELEYIIE